MCGICSLFQFAAFIQRKTEHKTNTTLAELKIDQLLRTCCGSALSHRMNLDLHHLHTNHTCLTCIKVKVNRWHCDNLRHDDATHCDKQEIYRDLQDCDIIEMLLTDRNGSAVTRFVRFYL